MCLQFACQIMTYFINTIALRIKLGNVNYSFHWFLRLFLSVNWADSTKHNSPQPLTLPKELGQFKRSYDFKEYGRFKSYEVIHNVRKNKFSNFSCMFLNPNIFCNLNLNWSNLLGLRNFQEQVKTHSVLTSHYLNKLF